MVRKSFSIVQMIIYTFILRGLRAQLRYANVIFIMGSNKLSVK